MTEERPPSIHQKIRHLSWEQIEDLTRRYYAGEAIPPLLVEFDVDVRPSELPDVLPPKKTRFMCPYCSLTMWQPRRGRADDNAPPRCLRCAHEPPDETAPCSCANCEAKRVADAERRRLDDIRQKRDAEEEAKKQHEQIIAGNRPYRRELASLSARDLVYLASLLRSAASADLERIRPRAEWDEPLAPTFELEVQILHSLTSAGVIAVHPSTPPAAILLDEQTGRMRYYVDEVTYSLNVTHEKLKSNHDIAAHLMSLDIVRHNLSDGDRAALNELWADIAREECVRYAVSRARALDLDYDPREKGRAAFDELLRDFAPSQVHYFIHTAVKDPVAYLAEHQPPPGKAANTIHGSCQRRAERARASNWQISHYRPLPGRTPTVVTILFDRVLRIGDAWFNTVPGKSPPSTVPPSTAPPGDDGPPPTGGDDAGNSGGGHATPS